MATAPVSRRLNLTRDQLAHFLTEQQQIRQFELLFSVVDEIQAILGTDFLYQAGNAAATANEALAQINAVAQDAAVANALLDAKIQQALDTLQPLAQDTAVNDAVLNAKVQQALDAIPRLTQALELLALAPVPNDVQLEHNVNGVLPVKSGGTGQSTFTNGQLLIGNSTGNTLTPAVLTAGANITITDGPGSITIASTGASGSFTTADTPPQTVTVVNGIITSIV
jgi:FtsZ-binding cell division protein ZapB